ncbi:hypothetical protein EIP86_001090 [Pleurotus ostreatoroseus]|nr:hypothetical protein EIP86_001090 [Pleurotus ostreatoroseus]
MKFDIVYSPLTGGVEGSGSDSSGSFTITGTFDGTTYLRFNKKYPTWQWNYTGKVIRTLGIHGFEFSGTWGRDQTPSGSFKLTVKPKVTRIGEWSGEYRYRAQPSVVDEPMHVELHTFNDSEIQGDGNDGLGVFTINGTVTVAGGIIAVDMLKTYRSGIVWRYYGQLSSGAEDRMMGTWGEESGGTPRGTFELVKV